MPGARQGTGKAASVKLAASLKLACCLARWARNGVIDSPQEHLSRQWSPGRAFQLEDSVLMRRRPWPATVLGACAGDCLDRFALVRIYFIDKLRRISDVYK
jgi:hypothetical protein